MRKFAKSIKYAVAGLHFAARYERNFKIQLILFGVLSIIAAYKPFSIRERALYGLAILLMLGMEIMNSAIEKLCDEVTLKHKREIGIIKDLSAGAVALVSIAALGVWVVFIFA